MERKEALEIMNKITSECKKHDKCNECPLYIIYKSEYYSVWDNPEQGECALDTPTSRCDEPCDIDYNKLMGDDNEEST